MSRKSIQRVCVHIVHPPPEDAIRVLETDVDSGVEITYGPEPAPSATEVLVTGRPSREQMRACPDLRALVVPYAGIPSETRDLLLAEYPALEVYNLHHNAAAAAELAVSLLLAAAKSLIPVDRTFRKHDWRSRYGGASTFLLDGKTALVLGLGTIGTRIASVCHALGMDVHAVRRRPGLPGPPFVAVHTPDELAAVLPRTGALLICLPLTPETEGLIGGRELSLLPRSSLLVNVARGAIVNEEALYRALSEHRIAAAGIDVWYQYPPTAEDRANTPPSRFPFHELDNVVMSPHRGGAFGTEELERERMHELATTLNAIARGEPVPHRVDVRAGY
jgi:phosphoglycerate dehydrogenase-like enzyme